MVLPATPFLTARRRRAYAYEAATLMSLRRFDDAKAFSAAVRALARRSVVTLPVAGERL